MSLNIKNERVHALVRRASQLTGLSQTAVVEKAVERFVRDHTAYDRGDDLDALLARIHEIVRTTDGPTTTDHLYDEHGLPR